MPDVGMLSCEAPDVREVRYTMEAIEDESRFALVEIEVVSGERCMLYSPQLTLRLVNGQHFGLTVMAYDVSPDMLWFQASGMLLEEVKITG
jgi:hypothetical protein